MVPINMMSTTAHTRPTLYLIDGFAQIFRAYHAIRSLSSPVTQEPTNATFGFVGMLLKLLRDHQPNYLAVALDQRDDIGTLRSQIYPQYKATRSPTPEDLPPQITRITEICRTFHIPTLSMPGYEADDIIATLCTRLTAQHPDLEIHIVSRDKDLEQLLSDRVCLHDVHTDVKVDVESLARDKGITPAQVIDALTLIGDTSDNIPGVHGVGPKTAAKLIAQFNNLDNLLAHTDQLSGKLRDNIEAARPHLPLSRQLVTLIHDVPIDFDLADAAVDVKAIPADALRAVFKQLGFHRHLTDLDALVTGQGPTEPIQSVVHVSPASAAAPPTSSRRTKTAAIDDDPTGLFASLDPAASSAAADAITPAATSSQYAHADPAHYTAITTQAALTDLIAALHAHAAAGGAISVDTETDRVDPMQAQLCGVSLSWQPQQGVYIPVRSCEAASHLDESQVIAALKPLLEDPAVRKIGQNIKFDMLVLRRAGVNLAGVGQTGFDTMIASYLIDATRSSHKLDNLALAHLNHEMIPISDLIGSGKKQGSMIDLAFDRITVYAGEDADVALRLSSIFEPLLRAMGLADLFRDLEMPLVEVLAELEFNGILCDPDELDRQARVIDQRIDQLHDEILKTAGVTFNPDSPKQLADVLFKTLGCTVVKRLKTGPSTDSEVLARIADDQPPPGSIVAALILEYRQLTKLRGTYLQSLKDAINPHTRRIHASFNQTVTATGRLSSSDPNLQNIPIRTEIGRQIRKAFKAAPGHVLLSADYSQIELRLLAHLAQDPALMDAFARDLDIHTAVAAQVFDVPLDTVTSEQRSTAKMVNFGIVYGITPFGLARRLPPSAAGSSVEVAKQIIADYKRRYPRIDAFLHHCIEQAQTRGYVETIAHRRRPVPEVASRNPNMAAFGRRIAINTVVQGSAADLIKIAMVRIFRRIRDEHLPMKMLLQIHDELVFEVPQEHAAAMADVVCHEMVHALPLTVPLKVDADWGTDWFESK
jgi:DNA polymerase-1